uniref:Glucuronosyltransferase n=1 Tax=Panagrellus redivivus TaxID=6233 RepID=A0A7E4VET9_PANRE
MASDVLAVFKCAFGLHHAELVTRSERKVIPPRLTLPELYITICAVKRIKSIKAAYVYTGFLGLEQQQYYLTSLKEFGFKRVVLIDGGSILLSTVLKSVDTTFQYGEYVAVVTSAHSHSPPFNIENIIVVKKELHHFDAVITVSGIEPERLLKFYPQVKSVVHIFSYAMFADESATFSEIEKTELGKRWPGCKSYFPAKQNIPKAEFDYIWNHFDNKTLNDCLVKIVSIFVYFAYNDVETPLQLVSTSKRVIQLDVKNAPKIDISVRHYGDFELFKTVKFSSSANRVVQITITFQNELMPDFKVKTLESSPPDVQPYSVKDPFFYVEWYNKIEIVTFPEIKPPFSMNRSFHIGFADRMRISYMCEACVDTTLGDNEFPFLAAKDRVVTLEFKLDAAFNPSVTILKEEEKPPMILQFTQDNRLLVHGPDDYTGPKEYPAYASFKDDNLVAGAAALDVFKTDPEMVVYDLPRLLSNNSEIKTSNHPSWKFSVCRDSGDDVIINIGPSKTNPYTCFALILESVLQNLRENYENPIDRIGIKLPENSDVSQKWQEKISKHIRASIVIFH